MPPRPAERLSLRRTLLIVTGVVVLCAGACLAAGLFAPGLAGLAVWCAVLLILLAVERVRYKAVLTAPPVGEGWADTGERMIDPTTRRRLGVWCRAATGERAYVEVGG